MTLTQITEKGIKDGEIVNADINASAAIAKSKLAALDIVNADINASAAIAKSKLASLDIVNADINASAAIAGSKISPDFGSQNIATTGTITASGTIHSTLLSGSQTGTGGILKLARTGTANGEYQFRMSNDSGNDCNLRIYDVKASATRFTIDSSGNVGIGTSDPSTLLHLVGSTSSTLSTGGTLAIRQKGDTNTDGITISSSHANSGRIYKDSNGALHIYNTGGDINDFVISNIGKVGIGTTVDDGNKFTVLSGADGIGLYRDFTGNSTGGLYLNFGRKNSSGTLFKTAQIAGFGNDNTGTDGQLTFNTLNSGSLQEAMRIDEDGNVGIGITSLAFKLEINGGADDSVCFAGRSDGGNGNNARFTLKGFAHGGGANYGGGFKIQTRDTVNVFHDRLTIDSSGNVGIGDTSPASILEIKKSSTRTWDYDTVHTAVANYTAQDHELTIYNPDTTVGSYSGIYLAVASTGLNTARIAAIKTDLGATDLGFAVRQGGTGYLFKERMRIKSNGNCEINDGDLKLASGHGIDFSSTSDGSGANQDELFDDYEEGTFTATVRFSNGGSATLSEADGNYTKIGRLVHCQMAITISSKGSDTGNMIIGGLPYTADYTPNSQRVQGAMTYVGNFANLNSLPILYHAGAVNEVYAYHQNSSSGSTSGFANVEHGNCTNTSTLRGHITYYADS